MNEKVSAFILLILIWLMFLIMGMSLEAKHAQAQTLETSIVNIGYHVGQLPYSEFAAGVWIPTEHENFHLSLRYNTNKAVGSLGAVFMYKELYIRLAPITSKVSPKDTFQIGLTFTDYCLLYLAKGEIGFTYLWGVLRCAQ